MQSSREAYLHRQGRFLVGELLGEVLAVDGREAIGDEAVQHFHQHAAQRQCGPAEDREVVMDWCCNGFLEDPKGVSLFVEAEFRHKHEGACDRKRQGNRNPPRKDWQARHSVNVRRDAKHDVERGSTVKQHDVVRREAGVADRYLMPGGVLFGKKSCRPNRQQRRNRRAVIRN